MDREEDDQRQRAAAVSIEAVGGRTPGRMPREVGECEEDEQGAQQRQERPARGLHRRRDLILDRGHQDLEHRLPARGLQPEPPGDEVAAGDER